MDHQLLLGETDALVALERAWKQALDLLAPGINRPSFESFFKTAKPVSVEGHTITIGAASELAKIFLEKYSEMVKTALDASLGQAVDVVFSVVKPVEKKSSRSVEHQKEHKPVARVVPQISLALNEKYTFSNFIVGPSNRLAHAAAQAAAGNPGRVYNPFFLYGGPGLGKTHLLQAVGHYILENHPKLSVAYVSGEMFTSQYVTALREHKSEEFRRKYRSIDVWLFDDIQFLAGKERTKEEFFHTFNDLYQLNKQIILSSDRSPRDLSPLEERLKSRFESGLVVDIAAPDIETRIAILQNKADFERAEVPYDIIECIANLIHTNIRALEGALVTVLAYTSLMKAPLTIDIAQDILGRYVIEKKFTELSPDAVQRAVAQTLHVDVDALRSGKRQKDLVMARHIAMYLSRELTRCSLSMIGKAFGGRDHATIIHACNRIKDLMEKDSELSSTIEQLTEDLKAGKI